MKRVENSFKKQRFMKTLGAELKSAEPGKVVIGCTLSEALTQQHGYFHAGVLASIADSACGYAALSVMPGNSEVVSVEFKINLLRPCTAKMIVAVGTVLKNGRSLVVSEAVVSDPDGSKIFAKMVATMFVVNEKD